MAKFVITEEQYNMLITEDALNSPATTSDSAQTRPTITLDNTTGDAGETVKSAQQKLGSGADVNLQVPNKQSKANSNMAAGNMSMTGESRIITKKELSEARFKYLKENSKLYTVQDFLRK